MKTEINFRTLRRLGLAALALTPFVTRAAAPTDPEIAAAVRATYNYRVLLANTIAVNVDGGVVTLEGTVPDEDLKPIASDTAAGVPGVVRVSDRIAVEPAPATRSDDAIALKVHTMLLVSSGLAADGVHVSVTNGTVTLTGGVGSYVQKARIRYTVAEIDGVNKLYNELEVPERPRGTVSTEEKLDDASVTALAKFILLTGATTSKLKASVQTKEGVVVLTGNGSLAERYHAARLVSGLRGVKSVSNFIVAP